MNNNELMYLKENSSEISNNNKNLNHRDSIDLNDFKRIRKVKSQVNMWNYPTSYTKDYFLKKNLYSNIGSFFSNSVFNESPNWKENKMSIHKIIKQEKLNQIYNIENFHTNVKKLNKSQIILNNNKNYKTSNIKGGRNTVWLNNNYSNRSCDEISSNIKFDFISDNNNKSNCSTFNTNQIQNSCFINNISSVNNSKVIFPELNKNIINNTNKLLSKEIQENQNIEDSNFNNISIYKDDNNNINNIENKSNGNNIMLTLLPHIQTSKHSNYSQLSYEKKNLNDPVEKLDLISQNFRNSIIKKFGDKFSSRNDIIFYEWDILKLKIFQKMQKENLEKLLKREEYNTDKKICYYLKTQRRFENIWIKYRQNINLYLHFLFDKQNEMKILLDLKIKQKAKLEYQIEKLIIQNVIKQKDLENLVEIRNFLLQVKNKYPKQPPYFNTLLNRDSRKVELGNCILRTFVKTKNSYVMKFLDSLSSLKVYIPNNSSIIKKSSPRKSLKNKNQKQININKIYAMHQKKNLPYYFHEDLPEKDKMCEIPKNDENIFESVEEFLIILNNLKEKNLILLKQNENNRIIEARFTQQKEKLFLNEINTSQIDLDIIEKNKILNNLKNKNNDLNKIYFNLVNHKINEHNSYTEKIIRVKGKSTFIDMSFFKMVNYISLLKQYKYPCTLLLEKLIDTFKKFLACNYFDYNIEKCYQAAGYKVFDDIMNLNKNKIDDENKSLVLDYILILLRIYDDIWMFVKSKQKEYESENQNLKIIKKLKEEIQTHRKIKNAKEMRELLDDKRMDTINKLIEKWEKPIKYKRKVNVEYLIRTKNRNKSIGDINKKKKLYLESEFIDLTHYD